MLFLLVEFKQTDSWPEGSSADICGWERFDDVRTSGLHQAQSKARIRHSGSNCRAWGWHIKPGLFVKLPSFKFSDVCNI